MKPEGKPRHGAIPKLISLAFIVAAAGLGFYTWRHNAMFPSTDAATIDADIVHVASPVGGRIIQIPVAENAQVAAGDLLYQIDPLPYRLAVDQARADLALAQAALGTQGRAVSTQRSAASEAGDQVQRAATNLDLAQRTVVRLRPLAEQGYVPTQQLDQAETAQRDAASALAQARKQRAAAVTAVDTLAGAQAAVQARTAALAVAERALADTTVRASHGGRVVGLKVVSGEVVAPSQSLFTLVNTDEWFAMANFRETELNAIAVGDCVTAYSLIDRSRPIKGVVQGVGAGVLDTDSVDLPRALPYVERSLNWVRVAQRFPVRVRLEKPPENLMRIGATAVVKIKHGAACE